MKIIAKIFFAFVIITATMHSQDHGINRSTDHGYKYFKENKYDKAIEYWEKKVIEANDKYKFQAMWLMGVSHLKLSDLFLMASEIVSDAEVKYYNFLVENSNVNKSLVNLYKAIALFESGQKNKATRLFSKISSAKLNTNHKELLKIWKKLIKNDSKSNTFIPVLGFGQKIDNKFSSKNISLFQKLKFKVLTNLKNSELKSAEKIINKMDLTALNYTDKSKKLRDIRFYDPSIYSLFTFYHLLKAEKIFINLASSKSKKISKRASDILGEIYFLIGDRKSLQNLVQMKPNNSKIKIFHILLKSFRKNSKKYIYHINSINDEKFKVKIGYYLVKFDLDRNYGTKLLENSVKKKKSDNNNIYYSYSLLKKNTKKDIFLSNNILDKIYTRSRITDFVKNSPLLTLLYSYIIFNKSPKLSCPESIGMARTLGYNFRIFTQYHNTMQGICLFYSSLGEGEVKFD